MLRRVLWLLLIVFPLLTASTAHAVAKNVQVFDMAQEKVVLSFPNAPDVQQEVAKWLQSIQGLAPEVKPQLTQGVVVKIPVDPAQSVSNRYFTGHVSEINLLLRPGKKPLLFLFTPQGTPVLLTFSHDLTPFLKQHKIPFQQ